AQEGAAHFGVLDIQPIHLLHGLLYEEEGRASVLLTQFGADLEAIPRSFTDWSAPATPHPPGTPLPLSSGAPLILTAARRLAGETSAERLVASEHLLLTLLREDERLREDLAGFGLDFDKLEAELATLHG